jgi:SH3 domain-containing protein
MSGRPFGRRLRTFIAALLVVLAEAGTAPSPAKAAEPREEPEAFARIVVDSAELRSGPGVSYRVIYVAHRGETLAIDGRPSKGFWLRVLLSDGRIAYVLGDEVQPFAVTPGEPEAPTRPGFFAPPPLIGSRGGLALVSGLLNIPAATGGTQQLGYVEARPSFLLHETFALEAFVGDGLTSDGAKVLYGGGLAVYLAPRWVVCPFVGIFAGGASVSNPDSFIRKHDDFYLARAGGGVLFALRNRILVRLEATNLSLFTPETYENAQTYSAGLGVYF